MTKLRIPVRLIWLFHKTLLSPHMVHGGRPGVCVVGNSFMPEEAAILIPGHMNGIRMCMNQLFLSICHETQWRLASRPLFRRTNMSPISILYHLSSHARPNCKAKSVIVVGIGSCHGYQSVIAMSVAKHNLGVRFRIMRIQFH